MIIFSFSYISAGMNFVGIKEEKSRYLLLSQNVYVNPMPQNPIVDLVLFQRRNEAFRTPVLTVMQVNAFYCSDVVTVALQLQA